MKNISLSICLGLGDNIVARVIFDSVKHQYDAIRISHDQNIMRVYKNGDTAYFNFLKDIGNLLFTEKPYYFDSAPYTPIHTLNTVRDIYIPGQPKLQHLLCKGVPLNLGEEYVVITTKIRGISKKNFYPLCIQLWKVLNKLCTKYKIVIMGERQIESSFEYKQISHIVVGIYDNIIANLPADRIVDLTVPALGVTAPSLTKIRQDGLIMQQAKFVITLGLGGNVWLAATTANQIIGYRDVEDNDAAADVLFNSQFTSVKMFKKWDEFIKKLEEL